MDANMLNLEKEMAKRTIKQYCSSWTELRYDEIHNKPYFIGTRNEGDETETIYPINSSKVLTFDHLKAAVTDSGSSAVNLAIYGTDSSIVLYKAHLGLKLPFSLHNTDKQSAPDADEEARKRKIDSVVAEDDDESIAVVQCNSNSSNKHSKTESEAGVSELHENSNNDASVNQGSWGPLEI